MTGNQLHSFIMSATEKPSSSHLIDAYNEMMASIRRSFDDSETTDASLQQALLEARDHVVHLGVVTAEEAVEIGEYIKRDINDAAEYMMESSAEFSDWLMLDIEVIERKVVEMFLSVADRTRVELEQLKDQTREMSLYYSGEITGPGMLVCTECGYQTPFATTSHIMPCQECGNNTFRRADIKQLPN